MQAASKSLKQKRPPYKRRSFDKPWFGPACKIARKKYHRARNIYNQNKNNYTKNNLNINCKLYKQTMNKYINLYKNEKTIKLRAMQTKNPKDYWKYLKSLNTKSNKEQPTLDSFYEHFKNINKSNESKEDFNDINLEDENNILNRKISIEEIDFCIKNIKNGKSSGEDKILNEYIKSTKGILLPIYEKLFNVVFDSGLLPNAWLEGSIRPIYKNKGDPKLVQNYRPITILSCLGKVFTAVLNRRLTLFLDNNETLLENQAGFRKNYSTTDHIFVLNSLIEILKASKQKLFCAFVDFSQAFDSIWRVGLWRKLLFNSVNGKFFRIIHSMYENIKSCVKLDSQSSSFFASECGVRQGENLSPLLFSLYLNDLETFLLSGGVESLDLEVITQELHIYLKLLLLLYADDTVIFSNDKENFQICLDNFYEYCIMWKLNINFEKTKIVIFNSKSTNKPIFKIGASDIQVVDSYKYLGVILSKSGSFLNARKHITEQARKAMHLLFMRANNLDLPLDLQLKLFDNTVLPILTYGSEIWGYENTNIIERIHTEFLRRISGCRKSTPKYILYAELGRYPIEITIKQRMINFWVKLLTGKISKLSYNIYLFLLHSNYVNSKWILFIKSILNSTGRSDIWFRQPNQISFPLGKLIKQNLQDQFLQTWNSQLDNSSKGRNYSLFKTDISCESYITVLNGHMLYTMLKFRTSNHKLPIEVGRWNNIDISDRKCNLCQLNDTGDEFHYLLICPFFQNERKVYIKQYYYRSPNIIKFRELLQIKSEVKLKRLSKFMKVIMSHFS